MTKIVARHDRSCAPPGFAPEENFGVYLCAEQLALRDGWERLGLNREQLTRDGQKPPAIVHLTPPGGIDHAGPFAYRLLSFAICNRDRFGITPTLKPSASLPGCARGVARDVAPREPRTAPARS